MLDKIINILERLDYPVNFQGPSYVATTALFRDGNNQMALLCYEDGPYDQVEQRKYQWDQWIAKVKGIKIEAAREWLAGAEIEDGEDGEEREEREEMAEKIKVQKVLVEADYADLVKSYDFFLRRGISKETLDSVGASLAQSGPLYGRVVFKIRNDKGKLVGVAGRDVLNRDSAPKWKLKGTKSDWIYPAFERNLEAIRRTGQIVIVESIGDVLALLDQNVNQVLCNFGLSIGNRLGHILKMNPQQIFLGLNNDEDKEENRGQIAAAKLELKLKTFFSGDKIINAPPSRGDFGEMSGEEVRNWAAKYNIKF